MIMMMLIKKNTFPFIPCFSHKHTNISCILKFYCSSVSKNQNQPQKYNFITNYLISSCGFSPLNAVKASISISHLKSLRRPDSVMQFFKQNAFDDASITKLISRYPRILCADVKKTLQPNIDSILKLCLFKDDVLKNLIIYNPRVLISYNIPPRIKFWKEFFKDDMQMLLIAIKRNCSLIGYDIDKNVIPKITLFKNYGLTEDDIKYIMVSNSGYTRNIGYARNIDSIEALLKRTQEMGFKLGSKMSLRGLTALDRLKPELFKTKMEFFMSFGWSEIEFLSAFRKYPLFAMFTEKNVREKMEFLVEKAGCTQSYIASNPTILSYSLKKRLMPRYLVVKILISHKLVRKEVNIYNVMCHSEKNFLDKFILPFKYEFPKLDEAYGAACAGKNPTILLDMC